MTPTQAAFRLLARNRVSILIFHRVLPTADPIFPEEVDAARFDQMMGWVKSWFNVVSLDTAVNAIKAGKIPPRTAVITFDDGYADNHDVALPILQKHGLPATFFIATGFIDGGRMWNDTIIESIRHCQAPTLDFGGQGLGRHDIATIEQKRAAIEKLIGQIKYLPLAERLERTADLAGICRMPSVDKLMMTSEQVCALRDAGMQIGAHTVSHPILARSSLKTAREEIAASKQRLESMLGQPIRTFAYPNGKPGTDYLPEHAELVKKLGFSAAVSTQANTASSKSNLFELPRFTPWSNNKLRFASQLIRKFY